MIIGRLIQDILLHPRFTIMFKRFIIKVSSPSHCLEISLT